jgi:hypothetical protein
MTHVMNSGHYGELANFRGVPNFHRADLTSGLFLANGSNSNFRGFLANGSNSNFRGSIWKVTEVN